MRRSFDYFLKGTNEYYLCVPKELSSIHSTKMGIAISSIICSYLDVYENESDFRELFNAGSSSERMMILRESVDDATIKRAREVMNDEEDNRDEFIQIIDRISEIPLKDVMEYIDMIDFERLSSIVNSSAIITLFKALDIDIDIYNREKPSVLLDLSEYYRNKIEDELPKYREKYNLTQYAKCFSKGIEQREKFQALKLSFNNAEIKYDNSVFFDVNEAIIKQLGIDMDSQYYDLESIYRNNFRRFKKEIGDAENDRIDSFIQYPENGSLIYFGEYEELKRRFIEYIAMEEKNTEEMMESIDEEVEPVEANEGIITPLIPKFVKGKTIRKTGGSHNGNKQRNSEIGFRGEKCVYQLLKSDENKKYVLWVSENAKRAGINPEGVEVLGYDMEYVDEKKGKCFVEVKASSSSLEEGISFHLSENEYRFACENSDKYFIYYVASVDDKHPKVVVLGDVFRNEEFNDEKYFLSAKEYYVSANYKSSLTLTK